MEKVRPWCGQPSDGGRLTNKTEENRTEQYSFSSTSEMGCFTFTQHKWSSRPIIM